MYGCSAMLRDNEFNVRQDGNRTRELRAEGKKETGWKSDLVSSRPQEGERNTGI